MIEMGIGIGCGFAVTWWLLNVFCPALVMRYRVYKFNKDAGWDVSFLHHVPKSHKI